MQNLIAESTLSELKDRGIDLTDSVMLELGRRVWRLHPGF